MRTPCQDAPEAWVGDDKDLRAQAAADCQACPALKACAAAVAADPSLRFGVMAGVDYSRRGPKTDPNPLPPVKVCESCGGEFKRTYQGARQWARAKFCGLKCANRAPRGGGVRQPIKHGTATGARLHYRRGEKPCESCRQAASRSDADRRASA